MSRKKKQDYTFVARPTSENGRTLLARVNATNFNQALNTALSVHPNMWLSSAHAPKKVRPVEAVKERTETTERKKERIRKLLINKIPMILHEAKEAAKKESKAQKKKVIFVYNDEENEEVEYGSLPNRKKIVPLHAYLNGKEIELADAVGGVKAEAKEETQQTKNNIQISNNKIMAKKTKKSAKKATKKAAKKVSKPAPAVKGTKKTFTVKEGLAMISKGYRLFNENNKPLPIGYMKKMTDLTREIKGTVVAPAK